MSEWNRGSQFEQSGLPAGFAQGTNSSPRKQSRRRSLTLMIALPLTALTSAVLGGFVGSFLYGYSYLQLNQPAPIVVNETQQVSWVTGAAAEAAPSVVTLSVTSDTGGGSGSGVILSEDGYILTNAHVVTLGGDTDRAEISVRTWDGNVFTAELVGIDSTNDLAVIKVSASGLKPISFADSNSINVGSSVVAIGAPLGLESTVTQGIVSALDRTIQVASSEVQDGTGLQLWNESASVPPISLQVIQTDAAINPGNSGGALVNEVGQLVGINVAIATAGNGAAGSIGVGFAIPANLAQRIADEIISQGSASHGLLGALVSDTYEEGVGFSTGATVVEVTAGGAAELGGVLPGDVIIEFEGKNVESASDLTALVRSEPAGATVSITVKRGDRELVIELTLGNAADLN